MSQVAIIMGSDSDLNAMSGAIETLQEFGIKTEVKIVSAHRTPKYMQTYASGAKKRAMTKSE